MKHLLRAIALLAYGAGILIFFECSARVFLALGGEPLAKQMLSTGRSGDDASWRLLWTRREHREGITYGYDVPHTTRGWALAPGLQDQRAFGDKLLSSNSRGIRGRSEHPFVKTDTRIRILAFGDSFTFGEDVGDEETYPQFLEQMLPESEVINCGVQGYGHDQMLIYLKEEGIRYHPDVVVLGFVGDDMARNLLTFRDYAKPRFKLAQGRLVLENTPVPLPLEVLARERYRSRFVDLLTILHQRFRWITGGNDLAMKRITTAILDDFCQTVEGSSGRAVLAYLPVGQEIVDPAETSSFRFFADYCRERRTRCVDLRPAFLEEAGRVHQPLKTSGHWSRKEHRIAARALKDYLLKEDLVVTAPRE